MRFDLEEDPRAVFAQFDEIEALAADPDRAAVTNAAVSGWSVARQLHHVALVALTISTALRGLARGRGQPGPEPSGSAAELLRDGTITRGMAQAPESLTPAESPVLDELHAAIAKARSRWDALRSKRETLEADELRVPHPVLGPMCPPDRGSFGRGSIRTPPPPR